VSGVVLPPGIEAVLFDFDGVLADTEPIHWRVWRSLLAGQGIDLTWDYYREKCIGITDRRMLEQLAKLAHPPKAIDDLIPLKPLKNQLFYENVMANLDVLPETRSTLEALRGTRLGIVTSSTEVEISGILNKLNIENHFETVVFGNQVRRHKPDPEPYREASRRLGISRALVYEDSDAGLESAQGAGHLAVRVPSAADLAGTVIRSIRELGGAIG
jgi:beta-phosphoglucomutase